MRENEVDEIVVLIRRAGIVLKTAIDQLVEIAEAGLKIASTKEDAEVEVRVAEPERRFISTKELAIRLGISPVSVHRLRKEGLPDLRIGHRVVFDYERVSEWVNQRNEVRKSS